MESDRTCAKCRKHMEPASISGTIPNLGNVCGKCWKEYDEENNKKNEEINS